MAKKWILRDKAPEEFFAELKDLPRSLVQILYHRGLREKHSVESFLNPIYGDEVYNPDLLPDIAAGVKRAVEALEKKEQITIYADYDADAVTAAAVMIKTLNAFGAKVDYYIPDRFSEGYGVNADAIREIAKRGTKLIITVDCGVTAVEEVEVAKSLGVDVVITDHHHVPEILPKTVAVINPHRSDSLYPFTDLTGVGVAFKFCQALLKATNYNEGKIKPGYEKWLLDLVAIGTVADIQDLLGENRVLVKYGLIVLQKTLWPGLKALISVARLDEKEFNTGTIGFKIAPRINAAGRLAHADAALKLLLTDDALEAGDLAINLEKLNRQRQQLTESILNEAREQVQKAGSASGDRPKKILLAASSSWPKGVVGLVAGKLAEEFYRPVLVGSTEHEYTTGSARSIPGFDLMGALNHAGPHAVRFGGHKGAAGFTVENIKLNDFFQAITEYAETTIKDGDLEPVILIDSELTDETEICLPFADSIEKLAPFGQGNPRPHFLIKSLIVREARAVGGEGKHAQIVFAHPKAGTLRCIAFSKGFLAKNLKSGDNIDVVGELLADEWNGNRRMQIKLIDWRRNDDN